jgi:hypothetical protein
LKTRAHLTSSIQPQTSPETTRAAPTSRRNLSSPISPSSCAKHPQRTSRTTNRLSAIATSKLTYQANSSSCVKKKEKQSHEAMAQGNVIVLNNFLDGEGLNFLSPNPDKLSKIMSPSKIHRDKNENLNPSRLSYSLNSNSLLSSGVSKTYSMTQEFTNLKEDLNQINGHKYLA